MLYNYKMYYKILVALAAPSHCSMYVYISFPLYQIIHLVVNWALDPTSISLHFYHSGGWISQIACLSTIPTGNIHSVYVSGSHM